MRRFGRSASLARGAQPNIRLAWLAGLLEAEGTFLRPSPSSPGLQIVACQMTDRDVVERVAAAFGTTVQAVPRPGRRTLFVARIKGSRAVLLMKDLEPAMGARRAGSIRAAVDAYLPPMRELTYAIAESIRDLRADGASISFLACAFGVSRPTIRQILDRSIYAAPPATAWRRPEPGTADARRGDGALSACQFHWLAGWLEGEGSFVSPPPCDPRRPRVAGITRDQDVAHEVGRLLGVTPRLCYPARERRLGWSPTWRLLSRGQPAVRLMKALHPVMGSRRQLQIESALAAVGGDPRMEARRIALLSAEMS